MKMMEILADDNQANPENYQFQWLKQKLDSKSNEVRDELYKVLEKQFLLYLQQKHPVKQTDPFRQRKMIQEIRTPKFDENQ